MNRKGLFWVSLLLVVMMLAISVAQADAGLRERIEYRIPPRRTATAGVTATASVTATPTPTPTALPYPFVLPTYTAVPVSPYPTPAVCPFWWLCATE